MALKSDILTISGWEQGIADSPHLGLGLLRNANIEAFPGAVRPQKKPVSMFSAAVSSGKTFTANAATDVCTASASLSTVDYTGAPVKFTTTGTLPGGLSPGTFYYLIYVSATTFKVASTLANALSGTAINITDAGTGVHTIAPTPIGTINWFVQDKRTNRYHLLDSNGRLWYFDGASNPIVYLESAANEANSTSNAAGNGLVAFVNSDASNSFIFVFRNNAIDVYNTTSDSWTVAWKTMNTGTGTPNQHHAIVAQDGYIYFTDAKYIGRITETTVFDPANAATYTYNNKALDLPAGEVAQCLEELGTKLLIGGNIYNKVYPWDRISDSFDLPLIVPEFSIKRLVNLGNVVYIFPGAVGNIYYTQGTYVRLAKKLPNYIFNNTSTFSTFPFTQITWGGAASKNNAVLFGLVGQTAASGGAYLLYADGRLVQDSTPSTGGGNVTAFFSEGEFYYMGYAGGADSFSATVPYSAYETVLHSALMPVGDAIRKAAYSQIEIQISQPTSTGNIRVKYRRDTSSAFGDFSTPIAFAADATSSHFEDIGLTDLENLQIQVEMDGQIELMQVRLHP